MAVASNKLWPLPPAAQYLWLANIDCWPRGTAKVCRPRNEAAVKRIFNVLYIKTYTITFWVIIFYSKTINFTYAACKNNECFTSNILYLQYESRYFFLFTPNLKFKNDRYTIFYYKLIKKIDLGIFVGYIII